MATVTGVILCLWILEVSQLLKNQSFDTMPSASATCFWVSKCLSHLGLYPTPALAGEHSSDVRKHNHMSESRR